MAPEKFQTVVLLVALTLITAGCTLAWLPLGPLALGSLLLSGLIWTRLRPIVPRPTIYDEEPAEEEGQIV